MAKRRKLSLSPAVVRFVAVLGLAFLLGLGLYRVVTNLLTQSSFFKIKAVVIDSSLQFIDKRDLVRLMGKNIFTVNLNQVQRQLAMMYPQMANVKIVRRFPDGILVVAKKRIPLAQILIRNKVLTVDNKGVVLATTGNVDKSLPIIDGIAYNQSVQLGESIVSKELQAALRVIRSFAAIKAAKTHRILKMNVESLSKIEFFLSEDLSIIVDWERTPEKMDMLSFLLSDNKLNLREIKYIDLRFKEPVIGKKNAAENKI